MQSICFIFLFKSLNHSFETWAGLAGWPGRPGTGTGPGLRKNWERQNLGWPGDAVKNSVATCWLFFLLKRHRFDLKKRNWPGDPVKTRHPALGQGFFTKTTSFWFKKKKLTRWPGQNPAPWPWTGSSLKAMF